MLRRFAAAVIPASILFCLLGYPVAAADELPEWKAGVATATITPKESMRMAGYASRTKPSDGTLTELHAKALAVEDKSGARVVIVTPDLIAISWVLRDQVCLEGKEKFHLDPAGLHLNCSHSHCSPVVKDDL